MNKKLFNNSKLKNASFYLNEQPPLQSAYVSFCGKILTYLPDDKHEYIHPVLIEPHFGITGITGNISTTYGSEMATSAVANETHAKSKVTKIEFIFYYYFECLLFFP
jgi:hypothetical protein